MNPLLIFGGIAMVISGFAALQSITDSLSTALMGEAIVIACGTATILGGLFMVAFGVVA